MKSQKKPTLKDIAKLAGISVNSASRALKQKKNISLKTQEKVRKIADKLGYIPDMRASALRAGKMDVIAIIYESRPNVTSDAAALALKSGNVCILRCGKEAFKR